MSTHEQSETVQVYYPLRLEPLNVKGWDDDDYSGPFFDTPEEAILHWESLGVKPTELRFEPDLEEIVMNGRVLPHMVWTRHFGYDA